MHHDALLTAVVDRTVESNHILPLKSGSDGGLNVNQTLVIDKMIDQPDQTDHTIFKVLWFMEGIVLLGIGGFSVIGKVFISLL